MESKSSVPDTVRRLFVDSYGSEPAIVTSAPGRVNLIGEHTDYNGGEVLPIAIGRRTWVAMRERKDSDVSRAVSSTEEDTGEFISPQPIRSGRWWDYIAGLGSARKLPAVDIAVASDVPAGAGLSSSAAIEVAAEHAYAVLLGESPSLKSVALEAWRVETQFVGVECGIMDQFASALSREGNALHVWCDTAETEHVQFVQSVLIFDTAAPRSLRSSEFNRRKAECTEALQLLRKANAGLLHLAQAHMDEVRSARLPAMLENRAFHVVTENLRVQSAVAQLRSTGTIDPSLLYESHASLRDRYQCSSPELDWFVDRAMETEGIEGARLTGAGWGGCAIAFGRTEELSEAGDRIAADYERAFGLEPGVWLTRASPGARIELQ